GLDALVLQLLQSSLPLVLHLLHLLEHLLHVSHPRRLGHTQAPSSSPGTASVPCPPPEAARLGVDAPLWAGTHSLGSSSASNSSMKRRTHSCSVYAARRGGSRP